MAEGENTAELETSQPSGSLITRSLRHVTPGQSHPCQAAERLSVAHPPLEEVRVPPREGCNASQALGDKVKPELKVDFTLLSYVSCSRNRRVHSVFAEIHHQQMSGENN